MVTFSYQAICFVSQTFGLCLGWSSSSRSSSRSSYNTKWISFRLFCAFLMSPRTLLIIYHIILLISLSFLCCRSCWYGYFDIWFWNVLRIRFECWPSNLVLVYWTYKLSTRFHIYVIVFYLDGKGGAVCFHFPWYNFFRNSTIDIWRVFWKRFKFTSVFIFPRNIILISWCSSSWANYSFWITLH